MAVKPMCSLERDFSVQMREDVTEVTMKTIAGGSIFFVAIFRMLQGSVHAPELWYNLKAINTFVFFAIIATQLIFQYPIALVLFIA